MYREPPIVRDVVAIPVAEYEALRARAGLRPVAPDFGTDTVEVERRPGAPLRRKA